MTGNVFPFLWLHGEEKQELEKEIQAIYDCGLRSFCVESRPHPDFCGDGWWRDLDIIFSTAKNLDMQVWLLDDVRYPTGYANDTVAKNPQLQQWHIAARTADVMGIKNGRLPLKILEEDTLLYAAAFAHGQTGIQFDKPIELTAGYKNGFLFFDLPCGTLFRIMTIWKTREGSRKDRMDMINPDSVSLLIENVYEPHHQHYKDLFGTVFAGFFSDEPGFFNDYNEDSLRRSINIYKTGLGIAGMAYPYSDEVYKRLTKKIKGFEACDFVSLWELRDSRDSDIRIAFMDIISDLYAENFSQRVGKWCNDRGIRYIGHIIEDMNCHLATGRGPGHYFKSQQGQDMAGIDIVLHQIKPYSTEYCTIAPISGGHASPEFFYHTLSALASSDALIDKHKNGNSMCEIFGAYGWGESIGDMKYMLDLMLVGGINHFVPHAFSPKFPDGDCPPHFYVHGNNPVYPAFQQLMLYAENMCETFSNGKAKIDIGVLYHAEACWSGKSYMPVDEVLKALHENQYNGIILPSYELDYTKNLKCLIVPYAEFLPEELKERLQNLSCKVIYCECDNSGGIIAEIESLDVRAFNLNIKNKNLRFYHYLKENSDIYMFFNSGAEKINAKVKLNQNGNFVVCDYLSGYEYGQSADNALDLELLPGSSVVIKKGEGKAKRVVKNILTLACDFSVFLKPHFKKDFSFYKMMSMPFDITAFGEQPNFSGEARLTAEFDIEKTESYLLEFEGIGGGMHLNLNGKDLGFRICNPFIYDISDYIKKGRNSLEITLTNTLANAVKDKFSLYNSLTPLGITSIKLLKYGNED